MKQFYLLLSISCLLLAAGCSAPVNENGSVTLKADEMTFTFNADKGTVESIETEDKDGKKLDFLCPVDMVERFPFGRILMAYQQGNTGSWTKVDTLQDKPEVTTSVEENYIGFEFKFDKTPIEVLSSFRLAQQDWVDWQITLIQRTSSELELGDLAFTLPFNNNYYEGFSQTDESMQELFATRFYIQKYIGGFSSYILLRRLNGQMPCLLFVPGPKTGLEFTHHIKTSWEGIPIVYVFSKASRETLPMRQDWLNGHHSLRWPQNMPLSFMFRFALLNRQPHGRGSHDMLSQLLTNRMVNNRKIVAESAPSMTVPVNTDTYLHLNTGVGIQGVQPAKKADVQQLYTNAKIPILKLNFKEKGLNTVTLVDDANLWTNLHYYVIDSPEELIKRRAKFIAENQFFEKEGHVLDGAFLVYNNKKRQMLVEPGTSWGSGGYEGGITDAMFLARKNMIYPEVSQIAKLEKYTRKYVLGKLQNPSGFEVAWVVGEGPTPSRLGRPYNYCHVINYHYCMYKIGQLYGLLNEKAAKEYLDYSYQTALAMFRVGWTWHLNNVGFMHYSILYELLDSLYAEEETEKALRLEALLRERGLKLLQNEFPYSAEPLYDTTGYEDVYFTAKFLDNQKFIRRTIECGLAQKTYVSTWFWCGSDKRYWDAMEDNPQDGYYGTDRGENCFHYTATQTSLMGLDYCDELRYFTEMDGFLRAYAGVMGILSLIHEDGRGSMCYTPDPLSNHYGFNDFSGDVGLGLYGFLRASRSYVHKMLPIQSYLAEVGFGCELKEHNQNYFKARLYDGVQQEFCYPNDNVYIRIDKGSIDTVKLYRHLRQVEIDLSNKLSLDLDITVVISGMWGSKTYQVSSDTSYKENVTANEDNELEFVVPLKKGKSIWLQVKAEG